MTLIRRLVRNRRAVSAIEYGADRGADRGFRPRRDEGLGNSVQNTFNNEPVRLSVKKAATLLTDYKARSPKTGLLSKGHAVGRTTFRD